MLWSIRRGRLLNSNNQIQYQLFIFPCKSGIETILSSCVGGQVVHNWLCRVAVTVKRRAGEVNCLDKNKLPYVAFTFDVSRWKSLTCWIFLKSLKQLSAKLLWLLPLKTISSGEERKTKKTLSAVLFQQACFNNRKLREKKLSSYLGVQVTVEWAGCKQVWANAWSQASGSGRWTKAWLPSDAGHDSQLCWQKPKGDAQED